MNYIEFLHNRDKYLGENHNDFLMHYGVLGQKWGQRHWQNPDGTYTTEGKIRYFGSKKAQAEMNADETKIGSKTSDAKDYLKFRNKMLKERTRSDLNEWYRDKNKYLDKQLVRDAKRVDKQQEKMYKNQLKDWYDNPEDLVADLNAMYKISGKEQKIGGLFSKKEKESVEDMEARWNREFLEYQDKVNKKYDEIKGTKKADNDSTGGIDDKNNYYDDSDYSSEELKDNKKRVEEFKKNYDKHLNIILDEIVERETEDGVIPTWYNGEDISPEQFKRCLYTNLNWQGKSLNGAGVADPGKESLEVWVNDDGLFGYHSFVLNYDPLTKKVTDYEGMM